MYHIISACSKLAQREYQTRLNEKSDPLGIVQKIKIRSYRQMVQAQIRIRPGKEDAKNSLE